MHRICRLTHCRFGWVSTALAPSVLLSLRILRRSTPEEQWLERISHICTTKVLAKDVRRVLLTGDVQKLQDLGGDSFMDSVVVECGATLVEY